jgi:transposase
MLKGIFWTLRTGAPWRDLPERFGPWQSVYDYYRNWRNNKTFNRILQVLQIRLDQEGKIDWDLWCIDGSSVRASRAAAGALKSLHTWANLSWKPGGRAVSARPPQSCPLISRNNQTRAMMLWKNRNKKVGLCVMIVMEVKKVGR